MNKPDPIIPEEMLSAYLDGELPADEQQLVANALQQSAELRSLFEELSQLREELQNLPKYKLPEDFAAQIARSTQTEPSLAAAKHAAPQPTVAVKPPSNANESRFRWIAGIAASAAVVLLALWAINPNGLGPNVALSPKTENTKTENTRADNAKTETDRAFAPMPGAIADNDAADQMGEAELNNGLDIKLDKGLGGDVANIVGGRSRAFGLDEQTQPPEMSADTNVQSLEFRPKRLDDSDLAAFADSEIADSEIAVEENGFGSGPDVERPFDAVVTLALRPDQLTLTNTGTQAMYYRLDDVAYLYESLARGLKQDLKELSKGNAKETKFLSQLEGLSIPKNAKLMVLEGTTQQLSSAFAELGTTPRLVKQSTDLRMLGLPQVELLAAKAETIMRRQPMRSASPAGAAPAAVPAAAVPANTATGNNTVNEVRRANMMRSNDSLKRDRESTLDQESLGLRKLEEEDQATAGRYRVLLIVEPK